MLSPAEHALDDDVCQESEAYSMFGARCHTPKDGTPDEFLIESLSSEISQNETPIGETVSMWVLLGGVACDCRRDRIKVLTLLPREVEIGENDPILEKGDSRHTKRNVQPPLQELAGYIRDRILKRSAL
jgi:hypothetical protein